MFRENIKMSWNNIIHNRMRSFLTALGIVIGVMSIIALITIVQAATSSVTSQFEELGASKLTITAAGTPLKKGLTDNEVNSLKEIDGVRGVSPTLNFQTSVARNLVLEENVSVEGKNEMYFSENPKLIARGRGLNLLDMSSKNKVCVINPELAKIMFTSEEPLGQSLQIKGVAFTVVGVIDEDVTTDIVSAMQKARGTNISEGKAIIPYNTAMSLMGANSITSLDVFVENTEVMDRVTEDVERALNQAFNYKDDSFSILNMDSMLDAMNSMLNVMTMMLVGIASIALLVGGIGIMNMMLVSVTERTTEIGLRKALGAEPKQIQMQFLMESIFLSVFGGILGMVLGLLVSAIVINALDVDFAVNMMAIVLGFSFSSGVGMVFGWAPARKASKLNPIDALRSM